MFLFICYCFDCGPNSCNCPVSSLTIYRRVLTVHKLASPKPAWLNLVSISRDRSYLRSPCRALLLEDQGVARGYTSEESTEANFFGDWNLHSCSRHHHYIPLPCDFGVGKDFFPAGKFTSTLQIQY